MANSKVSLTGRIVFEPELQFTAMGKAVCNFKVAVDNQEELLRITTWEALAEACADQLCSQNRVSIVGRPYTREWDAADGEHKAQHGVTAYKVYLLDTRPGPTRILREIGGANSEDQKTASISPDSERRS